MIVDFIDCFIIEQVCKRLFANLEPKPMVTRGRERRERRRAEEEKKATGFQEVALGEFGVVCCAWDVVDLDVCYGGEGWVEVCCWGCEDC